MAKEYGVSKGDQVADAAHTHKHPPYMAIFYILLVLTVVEVGSTGVVNKYIGLSPDIAVPHPWVIPWLLILSSIKAVLVAMYYMHLKFDKRLYSIIFGGPLLFAAVFVILTIRWD
jgi:cytochrome c oxidase subunit IV